MRTATETNFLLFCLSGAFLGIYAGLYDPSFNNYIAETFQVSESVRGGLEFFRELPGFLVVLVAGLLISLSDVRIAMIALSVLALGLLGQGFLSPSLSWAVLWMMMWSIGAHLFMPLQNSIVVSLSTSHEVGSRLGLWNGINTAAALAGYLLVFLGFRFFELSYSLVFALAALATVAAGISISRMNMPSSTAPRIAFIFKRRYRLYYLLNILFGARKQIFLTFGPWVLIKIFQQPVSTLALLGLIGTFLGIFFKPALGIAIDRVGERAIILIESLLLVLVCLGYGFAPALFPTAIAFLVSSACFIADTLLFACNMARATYLHKIVETPADLTPTLSMGVTLDHAVSMTIPFFAGILWEQTGFQYVFLSAAILALFNFVAATQIPDHSPRSRSAADQV